jgi:DMSO/TMAO reductase YedYZ molybdopterin-dependent catalytic subunit
MVFLMLLLRVIGGVPTTFELFGDRIAPLIPAPAFSSLIQLAGGYNPLKMLGVVSVLCGQLTVATVAGGAFAYVALRTQRRHRERSGLSRRQVLTLGGLAAAAGLVLLLSLYPNLATSYVGHPRGTAQLVSAVSLLSEVGVFTLVVGLLVDRMLRARVHQPAREDHELGVSRRAVLAGGAGVALLTASSGGVLSHLLGRATFGYDGLTVEGPDIAPITPNDKFYVVTKNVIDPVVDPVNWRLEIGGLVERPATYSLADLAAFEQVEQETTLMCISNPVGGGLMSNAVWTGVRLGDLLEVARPASTGIEIVAHGVDAYSDTFPLASAMDPATLLVHLMNGKPLPDRHGAPVRVILPGFYGEKQVKWVTRIEVVDGDVKGFYETQGWGPEFVLPSTSRFDFPRRDTPITAGQTVVLAGVAFAGSRGVDSVEVSTDDGLSWAAAELTYPGTSLTWALWRRSWLPSRPGPHALLVRMTDGNGDRQVEKQRPIVPMGALGLHRLEVDVRG